MANQNKNPYPFVKTSDEETMNILKEEGLELVDYTNGVWTFFNDREDGNLNYSGTKVAFSNMLCI